MHYDCSREKLEKQNLYDTTITNIVVRIYVFNYLIEYRRNNFSYNGYNEDVCSSEIFCINNTCSTSEVCG